MHPPHIPLLWRFRLLRALAAPNSRSNRKLLRAWAKAEGGSARYNPLNTTEPWHGATDYNSDGVKNYPNGSAGISATAATLRNGHYEGIVRDLRSGRIPPCEIASRNTANFETWGTGAKLIEEVLGCR